MRGECTFAAHSHFVKEKDGLIRVAVHSHGLNRLTVRTVSCPVGNIQNIIHSVCGSKNVYQKWFVFGISQLSDFAEERHKTAFLVTAASGFSGERILFPYVFCSNNAPATFCRLIDLLFGDIKQIYYFLRSRFLGFLKEIF